MDSQNIAMEQAIAAQIQLQNNIAIQETSILERDEVVQSVKMTNSKLRHERQMMLGYIQDLTDIKVRMENDVISVTEENNAHRATLQMTMDRTNTNLLKTVEEKTLLEQRLEKCRNVRK